MIDEEWLELIQEAIDQGLTIEEIKEWIIKQGESK